MKLPMADLRSIGLASLIGITSLAVGATTSYLLVPLYLLAMGWLLLGWPGNTGLPRGRSTTEEPSPSPMAAVVTQVTPEVPSETTIPPVEESPKARSRGRTRGTRAKAKAKIELPPPPKVVATWVQVAPGKFVRVEMPESPSDESGGEPTPPEIVEGQDISDVDAETPCVEPVPSSPSDPLPLGPIVKTASKESAWLPALELTTEGPYDPSEFDEPSRLPCEEPDRAMSLEDGQGSLNSEFAPRIEPLLSDTPPIPPQDGIDSLAVSSQASTPRRLKARYVASGVLRSARVSISTRPASRRSGGRIGSSPRVVSKRD